MPPAAEPVQLQRSQFHVALDARGTSTLPQHGHRNPGAFHLPIIDIGGFAAAA